MLSPIKWTKRCLVILNSTFKHWITAKVDLILWVLTGSMDPCLYLSRCQSRTLPMNQSKISKARGALPNQNSDQISALNLLKRNRPAFFVEGTATEVHQQVWLSQRKPMTTAWSLCHQYSEKLQRQKFVYETKLAVISMYLQLHFTGVTATAQDATERCHQTREEHLRRKTRLNRKLQNSACSSIRESKKNCKRRMRTPRSRGVSWLMLRPEEQIIWMLKSRNYRNIKWLEPCN